MSYDLQPLVHLATKTYTRVLLFLFRFVTVAEWPMIQRITKTTVATKTMRKLKMTETTTM
jgi:hypothetical protein